MPIFLQALDEADVHVCPIIALRNPLEVCELLARRTAFWSPDLTRTDAALLWLRHMLEAEAATRNRARIVVSYSALLDDWPHLLMRIRRELAVNWPYSTKEIEHQVGSFLSSEWRHHARSTEEVLLDPSMRPWIADTYEALLVLQTNPNSTQAVQTLDRVRTEFNGAASSLMTIKQEQKVRFDTLEASTQEELVALRAKSGELREQVDSLSIQLRSLDISHTDAVTRVTRSSPN